MNHLNKLSGENLNLFYVYIGTILSFLAKVAKKAKKTLLLVFFRKIQKTQILGHVPVKTEQTKRERLISALYVKAQKAQSFEKLLSSILRLLLTRTQCCSDITSKVGI